MSESNAFAISIIIGLLSLGVMILVYIAYDMEKGK